jgi:hypothetical protein
LVITVGRLWFRVKGRGQNGRLRAVMGIHLPPEYFVSSFLSQTAVSHLSPWSETIAGFLIAKPLQMKIWT